MECIACGRSLTNDTTKSNAAAWTLGGDRVPYCADSEACRRDAEESFPDGALALCMTCESFIRWIDCPTGGWWAHEVHPSDDHDAVRMPRPPAPDPLGYQPTLPAEIDNSVNPGAWKKRHPETESDS